MSKQRIQSLVSAYPDQGFTAFLTASASQQLEVHQINAFNATAAENAIGLFHSVSTAQIKVYTLRASDADATAALLAGTATSFFTTSNNQGMLFQSKDKFNMVGFNVSQAQTGSPVYTYEYYNGSGWVTLPLLNTPLYSATGIQVIAFNAPVDWVVGDSTEDGDSTLFSIRVLATTAPSQAVQINSIRFGKLLKYSDSVPASGNLEIDFDSQPFLLQGGESIIPFFSYSNASNTIGIDYKVSS